MNQKSLGDVKAQTDASLLAFENSIDQLVDKVEQTTKKVQSAKLKIETGLRKYSVLEFGARALFVGSKFILKKIHALKLRNNEITKGNI